MNNFDFSLFPKIYLGGCSRKQNLARWTIFFIHVHTSCLWLVLIRVLQWGDVWPLSGAWQVPISTGCCCPGPANNQKERCEEMDHPSSLADGKGRNLANCDAFINAKLYRDAESKPSPAVKQYGPKLYHRALWKLHNLVTHTHKSTVPAMCYLMFHGRADLSSWGSGIIPKGYGAFSFGLVGNRNSYTK